jgi:DNA topoisomerase-1
VTLRHGPYGHYVQLGDGNGNGNGHGEPKKKGKKKAAQAAKDKPKRASLPRGVSPADMTLDRAVGLLSLPRTVGTHPESGEPITAGLGRFGPYLKHGDAYKSLRGDDDVLTIGLNRAVSLLAEPSKGGRRTPPGKTLGNHPADGEPVTLHSGRYGPYVRHGKTLASLPGTSDPEAFTLDDAVALVAAKVEKAKGGTKKAKAGGKSRKAKAEADEDTAQPANTETKRTNRKSAAG